MDDAMLEERNEFVSVFNRFATIPIAAATGRQEVQEIPAVIEGSRRGDLRPARQQMRLQQSPILSGSASAFRRDSRRSRASPSVRANPLRHISPAADRAGIWSRRALRKAPA